MDIFLWNELIRFILKIKKVILLNEKLIFFHKTDQVENTSHKLIRETILQ